MHPCNSEPTVTPTMPEGLDLSDVPLDILSILKLATASVTFSTERLAATLADAWKWSNVTDLGDVVAEASMQGSNNWVVDAAHATTGRPIMASDPHRTHAVPALRYLVHLNAPGFNAIGTGEPIAPGISMGHNGHAAFSLTIFYSDQEDLYVYETEPGNPDRYRYGNGWEDMRVVQETFAVKGCPDQTIPLRFTRHGPVLFDEPGKRRAFAVRSVWFEPGSAAYLRSLSSMRAGTIEAFRDAMRGWGVPSANHVYADTSGTIAWVPAGWTPIRPNWDGLLPVPGDGRYEWTGFLDNEKLPRVVNPEKGYFATANAMNLPDGYPYQVGYEWVEGSRSWRVHEVLDRSLPHSVKAACALQTDVLSIPARRLTAILDDLKADGNAGQALALLHGWNHKLTADSAAAALFELWWTKHLKPGLLQRFVADDRLRALIPPGDTEGVLRALEMPDSRFGTDPVEERNALLLDTLSVAWDDCKARLGDNPAIWEWGTLHHAFFEHPLSLLFPEEERRALNIGPYSHGGNASTPMHTGYRAIDFRTIAGASVRMVVDVGAWDNSRWVNSPGQSGDPRSPHYRDLSSVWAAGDYVPMLYSRDAVDKAVAAHIRLVPT